MDGLCLVGGTERRALVAREIMESGSRWGLRLTQEEAAALALRHEAVLAQEGRVEFGSSILPMLIEAFGDAPYLEGAEGLGDLMALFYCLKNETEDRLSDQELVDFMGRELAGECRGSLELLRDRALERLKWGGGGKEAVTDDDD